MPYASKWDQQEKERCRQRDRENYWTHYIYSKILVVFIRTLYSDITT
jgi:hypothetical protein